jgi:uncharacterized protein
VSTSRLPAARAIIMALALAGVATRAHAQPPTAALTESVNDFAHVIDADNARQLDTLIRSLQQASGDVVVVATIPTYQPYGSIQEYAVKMFENGGRGIGQRGKDNGVLVLVAVNDHQVWSEVGYDLEQFVTDGFAGETARQFMIPEFRDGRYGAGLVAGVSRIIARIAQGRNVTLQGVRLPPPASRGHVSVNWFPLAFFLLFVVLRLFSMSGRRRRGWYSGVGPFGGGFGGGFGGFGGGGFGGGGFGGGGGGFGGFGGGRSGGGGGGVSW